MLTKKGWDWKTVRKGRVAVDDIGEGGRAKKDQTELKGHVKYFGLYSKINEKWFTCLNRALTWEATFYKIYIYIYHLSSGLVYGVVQPRFSSDKVEDFWRFLQFPRWRWWQLELGWWQWKQGELVGLRGGQKVKSAGPGDGLIEHGMWKRQAFKDDQFPACLPLQQQN